MEKSHRELTAAAVGQGKTSCFNTSAGLQSLDELFGGKGGHPAFASDGVSHISLLHLAACVWLSMAIPAEPGCFKGL